MTFELGRQKPRTLLSRALSAEPPRLDLAALAVASLDADADEAAVLARLDALADLVRERLSPGASPLEQVQALARFLADEEGFRGDTQRYHAPENSFIDRVLERKMGLPILLSVVYLEVARRSGIPLYGVSFPGHFVVALDSGSGKLVVDPFHGGRILTEEGCRELLAEVAPQVRFTPSMISPASVKAITYRMLTNLKRTWLDRSDGERALEAIDLMLFIAPDHPGELRARAAVLSALGAYRAALADIERCLELSPDAPDLEALRLTARALRQRVDFLN